MKNTVIEIKNSIDRLNSHWNKAREKFNAWKDICDEIIQTITQRENRWNVWKKESWQSGIFRHPPANNNYTLWGKKANKQLGEEQSWQKLVRIWSLQSEMHIYMVFPLRVLPGPSECGRRTGSRKRQSYRTTEPEDGVWDCRRGLQWRERVEFQKGGSHIG